MDDRAEGGAVAMIGLISALLVAGLVAAGFSANLQAMMSTGQATAQGADDALLNGVRVEAAVGRRAASPGPLTSLELYVRALDPQRPFPLDALILHLSAPDSVRSLAYSQDPASNETYAAAIERDSGDAYDAAAPMLDAQDLVRVDLSLWGAAAVGEGDLVAVQFAPVAGLALFWAATAPSTFGTDLAVELR